MGQVAVDLIGEDEHPVGAYVAASLCAGEIFKFIRGMRNDYGAFAHQLWLDAAFLRMSIETPVSRGPLLPADLRLLSAVVAGIGAVGNGMLHTLYPLTHLGGELTLIDGDRKGIDVTNLNRYVLFGLTDAAALKASTASGLFTGSQLIMHPVDEYWQSWYSRKADRPLDLVISAVDKNSARHAIQNAYPRLVLGASTNEMRAQVNLYDLLHGGLCLRCRNPVEEAVPDDVMIAHLRRLSPKERLIEAERAGIDPSTLEAFLSDPHEHCGMISGETLQRFAGEDRQEEWSVGFVSLLSGVLLAAEYLKLSLDPGQVALDAQHNTFKFQFWRPDSTEANKIYHTPPERACFCQSSTSRSAMIALWGG